MIEKRIHYTRPEPEKAVLVAVQRQGQSDAVTKEYLAELAFLAQTSNVITLGQFVQKLERPETRSYVGKGKLEEIIRYVEAHQIDIIIFDDDLTPSQVRFLEDAFKLKILDRSLLILNIFSMRAQTAQSHAQVELAQYQYLYPRLTRLWTHLSKQRGGAGMRGPGEKELETDRRIVNDRISLLKERLQHIDRQSETRRKQRDQLARVAIVGYTNVGKSTLMNLLTQAGVLAENKLFATVDSTVRKAHLGDMPYLLTDTVGFIRKLPTHLIEAFKSTLDEVRQADVLIHVIDASSAGHLSQMEVVAKILQDINAADKPTLLVFNKMDAVEEIPDAEHPLLPESSPNVPALPSHARTQTLYISATKGTGITLLKQALYDMVLPVHRGIFPNYLQQVSI
jgi:GTPase